MRGDTIKCMTCGKTFKDITKEASNTYSWKGQDSRYRKFRNICPFCYSTRTRNTVDMEGKLIAKEKLIYCGEQCISRSKKRMECWNCGHHGYSILDKYGCCLRCETNLTRYPTPSSHPRPNLSNEAVSTEALGLRTKTKQEEEANKSQAEATRPMTETAIRERQENSRDFIIKSIGVFDSRNFFSRIELADMNYRKMLQRYEQRLLPFNNRNTYRKWRYGYAKRSR